MYDKKLDDEIASLLDEELQKILCKFLVVKRSTNKEPDKTACRMKAKEIMDLKPGTWGDGDSALVDALATCSPRELILVCRYFHANTGKTMPTAIDEEFSGDLSKYVKEILFVLCCPAEYLANKINDSLIHAKNEYCTAFNIICSREETDLKLIKRFYAQLFGKELQGHIAELYKRDDKLFLLEYLKNY